ncbi:MAG: DUF1638 domain-containing protein [archaeon]|nr:DUF1638 domain-containing protein [archaeon]
MAKGVLGIIICPMFEDELLYSLGRDPEIQRIVVLDNEHVRDIRSKMDKRGMRYDLVPEADFDEGRVEFDRSVFNVVIKANSLALHAEPADLKAFVEGQIRDIQPHIDALGLYYGLCGNFGWDVTEWCRQMGYKPAAVFRSASGRVCDDCIAVAVGGSERYLELERTYTGMFYVIPSFANNWQTFVMAGDTAKGLNNLPEETKQELGLTDQESFIRWMFEFCGYTNTLKIDTGLSEKDEFEEAFQDISRRLNLKPLVIEDGWVTLNSVEGIYATCKSFFE